VANLEELSRKSCKAMLIKLFQIINYDLKSRLKRQNKIITTSKTLTSKRNETKRNETKRNETKRNETKRNETARITDTAYRSVALSALSVVQEMLRFHLRNTEKSFFDDTECLEHLTLALSNSEIIPEHLHLSIQTICIIIRAS